MRNRLSGLMTIGVLLLGTVVTLAQEEPAAPAVEVVAARADEGLVALYRAAEIMEDGVLPDTSGAAEPLDLLLEPGNAVPSVLVRDGALVFEEPQMAPHVPGCFSVEPAWRLVEAIRLSGALTVEAWITSALPEQSGPARIVSISLDSAQRNVTLGQAGTGLTVRLRTTATGEQGTPALDSPENAVVADTLQHVVFTFDGAVATLFVNGEVIMQSPHFAGDMEDWDPEMHLVLGNEFDGNRRWYGAIHLVAIYSRELAAGEVRGNYGAGF